MEAFLEVDPGEVGCWAFRALGASDSVFGQVFENHAGDPPVERGLVQPVAFKALVCLFKFVPCKAKGVSDVACE